MLYTGRLQRRAGFFQPIARIAQSLVKHRWLLYELISRDLRLRYRGTALGLAWTLLNPLLFMAVYTLVFSVYLRIGMEHYALFLLAGIIPWNWFSSALQQGTSSILDGRMFVGKTVFPTDVLVLVPVISNLVNFLFSLPLLIIVVFLFGHHLGWPLLALPLIIVIQMILTLGALLLTATLNVFYRDFQQLVTFLIMLLFYLTPIFYPITAVPESVRRIVAMSPLAQLAIAYQDIFYSNRMPDMAGLLYLFLVSLAIFFVARLIFDRYKESFGEYL